MQNRIKATMNWDEAPDTIDPEIYSKLTGMSIGKAREKFNSKSFPRIPGAGSKQLANKQAVYMYDMGINPKTQLKESVNFLILEELKKINLQLAYVKKEEEQV